MATKLGEENELRKKVWKIINLTQANQLFVHSKNLEIKYFEEKSKKIKTKLLPEILSLCILNALVPNSAMLLIGGHFKNQTKRYLKYEKTSLVKLLGIMFTNFEKHKEQIEVI